MWLLFVSAFSTAAFLYLIVVHFFPRWNLLDFPERYGLQRKALPYPAGIAGLVTFCLFFLFLQPVSVQSIGVLVAVSILGIFSFLDDRKPLPALPRLLIQVAVACILFATGTYIFSLTNPLEGFAGFSEVIELNLLHMQTPWGVLPLLSGLFTLVWLLLTINALNWFDGIPGQVGLLSTIGFLTIGFLSLSDRVEQPELAMMAFVLAGIALAGLLFDFPPPRVVQGDTGAMFFGLMLGVLTIYAGGKVATAFLVLGVPLIDSVIVILQRLVKGKHPFVGSQKGEHLHHRLLAKGWSPRQVLLLNAGLGTLFGVTALFLNTVEKFAAGLVLLCMMLVLFIYSRPQQ